MRAPAGSPALAATAVTRTRRRFVALFLASVLLTGQAGGQVTGHDAAQGGPAQRTETPTVARSLPASEATTILGRDVIDSRDEDVGPLVDVLVDPQGTPVAGVIDVGGFLGVGTRRVAVAWHLLRFVRGDDGPRVVLDMAFSTAAAAAEYQGPDNTIIVIDRAPP